MGTGGGLVSAVLSLDTSFSRESLVYEPGYTPAELEREPGEFRETPIDGDWYHRWEDWM